MSGTLAFSPPPPEQEAIDSLRLTLATLRLAVPIFLLLSLALRFLSSGFLSLMDHIQSQGYRPLFPGESEELWDTVDETAAAPAAGTGEDAEGDGDGEGIRPVVIKESKIRRSLVLCLFGLVALSYFGDGIAQVVTTITSNIFTPDSPLQQNIIIYTTGGIAAFTLCAVAMALEERWTQVEAGWGSLYPKIIAGLGTVGEIAVAITLIRLISLDPEARPSLTKLPVIHLAILSCRLLLLVFLVLSQTTLLYKSTFRPVASALVEEDSGLLTGTRSANYGAMPANGKAAPKKKSMLRPSKPPTNRPPDPKSLSLRTLFSRVITLFPYLWPSKSILLQILALVCVGLMLVKRVVNVASPIFFGKVIQDLSDGVPPYRNIGIYIATSIISDTQYMLGLYLWLPIQQYTEREMTIMSFDTLLNLSLAYHTRRKTGELLRILDRSEAINNFFETLLFTFLPVCIDLPVAVGVLWVRYGVLIVVIVMGISFLFVGVSVILATSRTKLSRKLRDASQYMRQIQTDTLMNWETAKIFTAEAFESERLKDALRVYQKGYFRVYGMWNSLGLIQTGITSFGLLVCTFVLARRVTTGEMQVGNFVTFVSFLNGLYGPLNQIARLYRTMMSNLVDTEQLMDLLKEPKDIVDRENPETLVVGEEGVGIEFNDVRFSYDGKHEIIKGISFKVKPGNSVALVGPSGGGKSTVMRLLYRFYDVNSGSISVDNQDIRDLSQRSLRQAIGLVPQESVLFNETIRFNIAYGGGPDVTEEQIVEACTAASMYDRIMGFPQKFETRVGERGQRLSGGEKQRVAIARVILKNPPILLLDEATSALDTTNERFIQARLRELSKGRTTLAIAHRLSTIVDADEIHVLNEGVIAESGSHAELLALDGIYAELWRKQIESDISATATASATPSLTPAVTPSRGSTPDPKS